MTDEDKPSEEQGRPVDDAEVFARMRKAKEASEKGKLERALSRAPAGSVVRFSAVLVMGLILIGLIISSVSGAGEHARQSSANLAEIGELRKALADAEAAAGDVPDAASVEPALATAGVKGESLAEIQNDMAALDFGAKDTNTVMGQYADLVDESRKYFSPGALSGGAFLPQGRWYQPYEEGKDARGQAAWVQLPSSEWSWKFIPTKSVTERGSVAGVWEARLSDGTLLAWVTGRFDNQRAQWSTMVRGLTFEGRQRVGATVSYDEDGKPPADSESLAPPPDERELLDRAGRARSSSSSSSPSSAPAEPSESADPSAPVGADDPGLEGN